jgi:hypothetical protein
VTFKRIATHLGKILLVMLSEFDKTARHEVCSSYHIRFGSVRFADIGSVTTAFSGENWPAI